MSEYLFLLVVVVILSGIVTLAILRKDEVKATLKVLGIEWGITTRGGSLPERPEAAERSEIEALIRKHNSDYARAFRRREPRLMWETSTSDAYFTEIEPAFRDLVASAENSGIVAIEVRHILFQLVKLLGKDCATVEALETWEYIYGSGQSLEHRIPNTYTLKKEAGGWQVVHCNMNNT